MDPTELSKQINAYIDKVNASYPDKENSNLSDKVTFSLSNRNKQGESSS